MDESKRTAAVVGACGGAGATRLTVETAAALAREGRTVGVVDVAFETQGLADHVPGEIPTDAAAVLAEEAPLEEALVEVPVDAPGEVAACPARAPFERFARAQTAGAAGRLPDALATASERFDHVLVDAGPVATNQAVSAVTAVDEVAVVAPGTDRGANAVARVEGRLADVGSDADLVVANRGGDLDGRADVTVPESETHSAAATPVAATADDPFARGVADVAAALFDVDVEVEVASGGLLS